MAEEDDSQKTEEPTDKKLSRARQKGQVASSQEVKSWVVLLAGTAGIVFMAPLIAAGLRQVSLPYLEDVHQIPADFEGMRAYIFGSVVDVALIIGPFMLLIVIFAIGGGLLQFGLLFAPEKIKPELSKISLMSGLKRMFSVKSVVEFGKGILKLIIVAMVALGITLPLLHDITLRNRTACFSASFINPLKSRAFPFLRVIGLPTAALLSGSGMTSSFHVSLSSPISRRFSLGKV